MTTEQFLTLASREQDTLVAKLMNWTEVRFEANPYGGFADGIHPLDHLRGVRERMGLQSVPRYSTEIVAAWEVFEKANLNSIFRAETPLWGVGYGNDGKYATALTASLAICLAALKTKGVISES